MLLAAMVAVSMGWTAVPFALLTDSGTVDAAIIAGAFSVLNTILNARIIREVKTARQAVEPLVGVAEKVRVREGDLVSTNDPPVSDSGKPTLGDRRNGKDHH